MSLLTYRIVNLLREPRSLSLFLHLHNLFLAASHLSLCSPLGIYVYGIVPALQLYWHLSPSHVLPRERTS